MTETTKPVSRRKWLRRSLWTLAVLLVLIAATLVILSETGIATEWARRNIVTQIEKATGAKAELKAFRFHLWSLRAELEGFTLHGREPEGTPPLFYSDLIVVDVRIDSLWAKKFSLDEILVTRPRVHVRIDEQGRSNVPTPAVERKPGKPFQQQIFDVIVRKVRLEDGELLFNDVRVPLAVEGDEMNFSFDYHSPEGILPLPGAPPPGTSPKDFYLGNFSWKKVKFVARRYIPFESNIESRFTLTRETFTLDSLKLILPTSEIEARASLDSFAAGNWDFRYRLRLYLRDLQKILRKPSAPLGYVDASGEGKYADHKLSVRGSYAAHDIDLSLRWFDAGGIHSRGEYVVSNQALVVEPFYARATGGEIRGRVDLALEGLKFRVATKATGLDLAKVLEAIDHPGFPIASLHWDAEMDVDSVLTWESDFKNIEARGTTVWHSHLDPPSPDAPTPPVDDSRKSNIPVTGRIPFHYSSQQNGVELTDMEITTPESRITATGKLAAHASGLDVDFSTTNLLVWNDFINALRGSPHKEDVTSPDDAKQDDPAFHPWVISGNATWKGRLTGDVERPTFTGRAVGSNASYESLKWDEVEGDLIYSPTQLRLERGKTRLGKSTAEFSVWLEQDNWSFCDTCSFTAEANVERTPLDGLQELARTNYPLKGSLTGQFRAEGTRDRPQMSGLVDIDAVEAWGIDMDRVRGKLDFSENQLRVSNAEIRVSTGRITGNMLYQLDPGTIQFAVTGAVIPIEHIAGALPAGLDVRGQLSFQWKGSGPIRAPVSEGTLRIVDFAIGGEYVGSFEGNLKADGRQVQAELSSAIEKGKLAAKLQLTLGGDYPLRGDVEFQGIDVDPFIKAGLRLEDLTGHSSVDGKVVIAGDLAKLDTVTVSADLSRVQFNYRYLQLENVGPMRFSYSGEQVRVDSAHLKGPNTDVRLAGYLRFKDDRRVSLEIAGDIDLAILSGFFKEVESRGAAKVNGTVAGTLDNPRVTGTLQVINAYASFTDFPTGVSRLNGTFVFDSTRMLFENVKGDAGGGQLTLGGTVTYGDGPFRYELSARAESVRVRYPEGVSWHTDGNLRYVGTLEGATLSGQVIVDRVLLTRGLNFGGLVGGGDSGVSGSSGATATTNYMRNLQFDLQVVSSADARLEWSEARFDTEANMRVRGTWDHPIILGQIRLLSGDISLRGNRYRLTRGDINFINAFTLDPVINIEAVTRIRQYEVSLTLSGKASQLALAYRSDPPLPSSDIITLLALGRTADESERRTVGTLQGQDLGANLLLSEAVSSIVGGQVQRLFGISRFRIDPFHPADSASQNTSARITIEQQVTPDLIITYIANVTSTEQQIIQVEYTVNRDISIVGRRDENGTIGLDIKFTKRFK